MSPIVKLGDAVAALQQLADELQRSPNREDRLALGGELLSYIQAVLSPAVRAEIGKVFALDRISQSE